MNKIGLHIGGSEEALNNIPTIYEEQFVKTFQIFFGSPRRMAIPEGLMARLQAIKNFSKDINLIVHSPYVISLVKREHHRYTMRHALESMKHLDGAQFKPMYVTHLGKSQLSFDEERAAILEYIKEIQYRMTCHYHYHRPPLFTLEACVGHKNWSTATRLDHMVELIKEVGDPFIKICFDTEHVYASGYDITAIPDDYWQYFGIIHLNAIPQEVEFGKHLDRHSFTPLTESKVPLDKMSNLVANAKKHDIYIVMERRDLNIAFKDIAMVKELWGSEIEKEEEF